ncbi:hypothetical protein CH378_13985 [Leptospira kmetyi]|uniref:Uncharacterized protein n=1 Tax=Leptospira kmetyi TaxID=408139 RepID=A0ABX4N772_9LEPT|nr:hypothetical protein CH378_13985 [Leptospira kmetyi]
MVYRPTKNLEKILCPLRNQSHVQTIPLNSSETKPKPQKNLHPPKEEEISILIQNKESNSMRHNY